jgi:hypothetical protein
LLIVTNNVAYIYQALNRGEPIRDRSLTPREVCVAAEKLAAERVQEARDIEEKNKQL